MQSRNPHSNKRVIIVGGGIIGLGIGWQLAKAGSALSRSMNAIKLDVLRLGLQRARCWHRTRKFILRNVHSSDWALGKLPNVPGVGCRVRNR